MKEQVLILIKPDGVYKQLVGNVINMFLALKMPIIGIKMVKVSKKLATQHYLALKGQVFFDGIVDYLMGKFHDYSPVVALVIEGDEAIKKCRQLAGHTNPEEALPDTIRGRFGRITTKGIWENLVHVSSSPKDARREVALWFKKSELIVHKV